MKRVLSIILVLAMALCVVGCAAPATTEEEAVVTQEPVAAEATAVAEETAAPEQTDGLVWDGNENSLGPIMKNILKTGTFQVGYTAQKPPQQFHLTVDGKDTIVGFEVWMTDLIAQRIGQYLGIDVEQTINIFTVQGGLAALQAGQLDCMPTLSPTPERKENYDFSQAYHRSLQTVGYLTSRAGEAIWDPANGLEGVTVAVVKGTTNESGLIAQYPKCTVLSLEKQADVLVAVLTGKADAFLMNEKTAILYVAANPELMYDLALSYNVDLTKDPGAAYCVPKGNEDFVALIDEVLTQIRSDGTFEELEDKAIAMCENAEVLEAYMAKNAN